MKRFIASLFVAAATAGLLLAPSYANPKKLSAEAGPVCTYSAGLICGAFDVAPESQAAIGAIGNWGPDERNGYGGGWYGAVIQPGHTSRDYYSDTDGFYCGPGFKVEMYVLSRYGWTLAKVVYGGRYGVNTKISDVNVVRLIARRI